jgi:hypothetical protein
MGAVGSRISTLALAWMSPAFTARGPTAWTTRVSGWSLWQRNGICLRLRMMSVVSSTTPGTDENSCSTPSILTDVIAAPSTEDSRMRRRAFPIVVPKPRSNG